MAQPAKKIVEAASEPPPSPAHRFIDPDFDSCGIWLLAELQSRFRQLTERNIMGWLRGLIHNPEFLFLRNDKAVLLAQQTHEFLEPRPVVLEIFCLAQDGGNQHAAALYVEMKRWAQSLGALRLVVEEFTNVPHPMVVEAFGEEPKTEKLSVIRLRDVMPQ
jgi:hypothetical protein